jgi:predicted N-acetyltransferase YhbS
VETRDINGLMVGMATIAEALGIDRETADLDVVRVVDPAPDSWRELRAAGFAVKPSWVTWLSPTLDSQESFLDRLSVNERRNVRLGLRFVEEQGIALRTVSPLAPAELDTFLDLYDRQISGMRHGVGYARQQREELLSQRDRYLLVEASLGDEVLGGCLCWLRPEVSTLQIRFVTTAPSSRQHRLVRAMYMRACALARELGYDQVSLGSDPTLYGHIAKPGLFSFKARLGFVPVPATLFGSDDDPDEADLVLRLGTLSDPSLLLSYHLTDDSDPATATTSSPLRLDVLANDADTDLNPYRAPFLADVGLQILGTPAVPSLAAS